MSDKLFDDDILDERVSAHQLERSERRAKLREKKLRSEEKAKVAEENKQSRKKFLLIAAVVLAVLVALFGKNTYQIIQLSNEKKAQEEKLEKLEESIDRLNEELKRVTSDEYIEQQAREQLKMIYPGETLYVITE